MTDAEMKIKGAVPRGTASFVFWDGYGLAQRYSGVGHVAFRLYQGLQNLQVQPNIIASETPFFGEDHAQVVATRFPRKLRTSKLFWPKTAYRRALALTERSAGEGGACGIFHGLSNINVPWRADHSRLKTVVTIHDLTPMIAPTLVSRAYAFQFAYALKRIVRDVDLIVAVSEWTATTIKDFFPSAEPKIRVIKNGRPDTFIGKKVSFAEKEKIVLTVSRFEPYKNLPVIGRMAELAGNDFKFHVVSDKNAEEFFRTHHQPLLAAGRIHVHTDSSVGSLQKLYEQADCYLQPSLYEGFGLPILDALAHGLPIAYLKGSAVDEITRPQYAAGAEKSDPVELLDAVYAAVDKTKSPDFQEKTKREFLAFPTWDDAAANLKSVYAELL